MRFSIQLPTDKVESPEEFVTGAAVAEMARAIEGAGFDACFVTDHPFPSDRFVQEAGGHHALDPFVALSFAAAATERLRLQTHILVLPYRNPFHAAKTRISKGFPRLSRCAPTRVASTSESYRRRPDATR